MQHERETWRTRHWGVAALLLLAALPLAADAQAPQYGLLKPDGDYPAAERFWTKVNKEGVTAWRIAAEQALRARGFAEPQVKKFVRLQVDLSFQKPDRNGILKLSALDLPIRFNTETGESLPFDPVAYAKALPDCYAQDERTCGFAYSANQASHGDLNRPCLIPRRTVQFCQRTGFVNSFTFGRNASAQPKRYQASCGEEDRTNGCGADQVVFDSGETQTKLAFMVAKAVADAAPKEAAPPSPPAQTPRPAPAKPNVVYVGKRNDGAFLRREGPPEPEEWEYDIKAYKAVQKLMEKPNADFEKISAQIKQRFGKALQYCWPHDVYHPCDLE